MESEKMVTDSQCHQNDFQITKEDDHKSTVFVPVSPNGCPPVKKLKQGRLPFMPLDQKPRLISPQTAKKRKLSDPESPSAKTAKTLRQVIDDTLPLHPDENEVSSSSEAENIPALLPHPKNIRNTLFRFLRTPEPVSSTNAEVIDLTDSNDVAINNNEVKTVEHSDEAVENHLKRPMSPTPSNVLISDVKNSSSEISRTESPASCEVPASDPNKSHDLLCSETSTDKHSSNNSAISRTEVDKSQESSIHIPSQTVSNTETLCANQSDSDSTVVTSEVLSSASVGASDMPADEVGSNSDNMLNESQDELNDSPNDTLDDSQDDALNDSQLSCDDSAIDSQDDCADLTPAKGHDVKNTSALNTPIASSHLDPLLTESGAYSPSDPCRSMAITPKRNVVPKGLSAKQQKLLEEREKKRQELKDLKEKQRQEREEMRRIEKEKREKEKLDKKAQLERERQEKKAQLEKERLEKKVQFEKEKQEKMQQKEDEKKKKQEALDLKMEEKRKKEEEKKQKDEEKKKDEEEKRQKDQKVKSAFISFFVKKDMSPEKSNKDENENFMPFELKSNMRLAPAKRRFFTSEEKEKLDQCYLHQGDEDNYLKDIKSGSFERRKSEKTWPRQLDEDEVMIVHDSDTVKKVTYKTKLIQFHENNRPPYYGTWRKKSSALTPKNPFKQDKELFDYEVDSDDEWEEEDPGESVSSDEEEEDKDKDKEDDDEEEDGWMVPHGYLSEDEGCEEEEISAENLQAKRAAKLEAWEAELKRQYQPALPVIIGCQWMGEVNQEKKLDKMLVNHTAVCIVQTPILTVNVSQNSTDREMDIDDENGSGKTPQTPSNRTQKKPVPDEAIPDLIKLVHGNISGIKKLIREFRMYWHQKTTVSKDSLIEDKSETMEVDHSDSPSSSEPKADVSINDVSINCEDNVNESVNGNTKESDNSDSFCISKRQLEIKIMAIAIREKRPSFKKICWHVHESVLKEYKMEDISLNNTWQYVSEPSTKKIEEPAISGRKTPTIKAFTQALSPSKVHASLQKKEESTPVPVKNTPNILNFAQPLSPAQIHASIPKKEESVKVPAASKAPSILAFTQKVTPSKNVLRKEVSANEEKTPLALVSQQKPTPSKILVHQQETIIKEKCSSTSVSGESSSDTPLQNVSRLEPLVKQKSASVVDKKNLSPTGLKSSDQVIPSKQNNSNVISKTRMDMSKHSSKDVVKVTKSPNSVSSSATNVKNKTQKNVSPPQDKNISKGSKLSNMIACLVSMEDDRPIPDSTVGYPENVSENTVAPNTINTESKTKKRLPFVESSEDCIIID